MAKSKFRIEQLSNTQKTEHFFTFMGNVGPKTLLESTKAIGSFYKVWFNCNKILNKVCLDYPRSGKNTKDSINITDKRFLNYNEI